MRITLIIVSMATGIMLAGGAGAMTTQSAPVSGGGGASHQLVDPDEQTERLVEQTQRNATRGAYDRSSAASVMNYGNTPRGSSVPH